MPKLLEKKEIDGRMVELREFGDAYVIYAWPKERTSEVIKLEELRVFQNLEQARDFLSKLVKI